MTINPEGIKNIINNAIKIEGGYINDSDDYGGETKYGISKRSYPDIDIKNLTEEQAFEIYKRDFWDKSGIEKLYCFSLNRSIFTLLINIGIPTTIKCLQKAANNLILNCNGYAPVLLCDGILGEKTVELVNAYYLVGMSYPLLTEFEMQSIDYYRALKNSKYIHGWLNRVLN